MGTVAETEQWKIKIHAPPKEHGPAHVHVIAKGENAEIKVSLVDFKIMGQTNFSERRAIEIVKYVRKNYIYLKDCWEKLHVTK